MVLLIIVFSCSKEDEFDYPLIFTGEVTDVNNEGALFNGKITDVSKGDLIEYGFVWDTIPTPTIEDSEKIVVRSSAQAGVFSARVSTTLRNGTEYYVRAFARNSNFVTYGKEVLFTSLGSVAPQILNFSPRTGNTADTLIIYGRNFSYTKSNNKVRFGELHAAVIKASQDTLVVLVPQTLNLKSSAI